VWKQRPAMEAKKRARVPSYHSYTVTISVYPTTTTTTTTKSTLKHLPLFRFSYIHLHPEIIPPTKQKQKQNFDLSVEELNNPEWKDNNIEQRLGKE
jgi:hypothetical protein